MNGKQITRNVAFIEGAKGFFPAIVHYADQQHSEKVASPDQIRAGVSFRILKLNA